MRSKSDKAGVEPEAPGNHSDEILTDRQVAAALGVPLATLRFWWSRGDGPPSLKCGRYRRVMRSALLAWCRSRQQ